MSISRLHRVVALAFNRISEALVAPIMSLVWRNLLSLWFEDISSRSIQNVGNILPHTINWADYCYIFTNLETSNLMKKMTLLLLSLMKFRVPCKKIKFPLLFAVFVIIIKGKYRRISGNAYARWQAKQEFGIY